MNIRMASLALAFTILSLPAYAQGGPPAGAGQTIQSLPAQLAALTERVAKLESGQVEPADLVGTYALFALGIEMHGGPARIGTETAAATLTLRADRTGSANWTDKRADLVQGTPWSVIHSPDSPFSGDFTWTLENGKLSLFVAGDDDVFEALIGAGGRVIVFGITSHVGAGSWSQLGIAIRLP